MSSSNLEATIPYAGRIGVHVNFDSAQQVRIRMTGHCGHCSRSTCDQPVEDEGAETRGRVVAKYLIA